MAIPKPTLSRKSRILLLLAIDTCFFFTELVLGYVIGSLALVADSFHMLNDVLSLVVALYAIKLASRKSDHQFTYGWFRAEILAALINGVFLLAICFTIFLQAIERFFDLKEIKEPKIVVIVGCLGLASNIVGLFLFHEHGHGHGHSHGPSHSHEAAHHFHSPESPHEPTPPGSADAYALGPALERHTSHVSLEGHPAAMRARIVNAGNDIITQEARSLGQPSPHSQPASPHTSDKAGDVDNAHHEHTPSPLPPTPTPDAHGHGHGHDGAMNMRGVLIHVLGDALGNIGVIAAGLAIWLSSWSGRFYLDPALSLVLTILIFSSALPLVRAAARVLLQGVPAHVSLPDIRVAIARVPGVRAVHELHVWQLSEARAVASVHVRASRARDFMDIAGEVRRALHERGVHSVTVQPEWDREDSDAESTAETLCLVGCPPDQACGEQNACCPVPPATV